MGAELYISQLFDPHYKRWQKRYYQALADRELLPENSTERDHAQKYAQRCYKKMYARGYFRDSYDDSDLMWKFGLSWGEDVIPMLSDKAQLTPEKASQLLGMLQEREDLFECNLASEQEPAREDFQRKYEVLQEFLNQAIQLGMPIKCSL